MTCVAAVPSQPNGLRVVRADATTAELAWDRPSHSGESIINYVVYYNDSYEAVSGSRRGETREAPCDGFVRFGVRLAKGRFIRKLALSHW